MFLKSTTRGTQLIFSIEFSIALINARNTLGKERDCSQSREVAVVPSCFKISQSDHGVHAELTKELMLSPIIAEWYMQSEGLNRLR